MDASLHSGSCKSCFWVKIDTLDIKKLLMFSEEGSPLQSELKSQLHCTMRDGWLVDMKHFSIGFLFPN
jgi:hypothetical protein